MWTRGAPRFRLEPAHVLLPLVAAVPLVSATRSLSDVDAYWHVVVGDEIRATRSVVGTGDAWAWYDPEEPWTTSQWLAEVAMSWLVGEFGWSGLVAARFVLTTTLVGLICWVVVRSRAGWAGTVLAAGTLIPFAFMAQERPLLVSWIATLLVGILAERILRTGSLPRWWTVPLVALWANTHGQWVIAPAALGSAAVLYWLSHSGRDGRYLVRSGAITLALVLAGCLTPLGVRGLTLPFELRGATSTIVEWRLTEPWSIEFIPLAVVLLVTLASWLSAGLHRQPEAAFVLTWTVFAMTATRNAVVVALLLLPLASRAAAAARRDTRDPGPREAYLLAASTGVAMVFAVVVSAIGLANIDALAQTTPLRIASDLKTRDDVMRVLNDYNVAGVLVAFGPSGIELGIDGRAERYGAEYIDAYLDALALRGDGWRKLLYDFQPDVAVLEADAPIRHVLEEDWGWQVTVEDGDYVLLEPAS